MVNVVRNPLEIVSEIYHKYRNKITSRTTKNSKLKLFLNLRSFIIIQSFFCWYSLQIWRKTFYEKLLTNQGMGYTRRGERANKGGLIRNTISSHISTNLLPSLYNYWYCARPFNMISELLFFSFLFRRNFWAILQHNFGTNLHWL